MLTAARIPHKVTPVAVLLRKVEADKNKTQTQASASLANADLLSSITKEFMTRTRLYRE